VQIIKSKELQFYISKDYILSHLMTNIH